jgi:hypothetical protein
VDQGVNWSVPVAAATLENANPAIAPGFRSRSHPSIDVDETTGRIYLALVVAATVTGAHGEAEQFIPVEFTVISAGSPSPGSGYDSGLATLQGGNIQVH